MRIREMNGTDKGQIEIFIHLTRKRETDKRFRFFYFICNGLKSEQSGVGHV